MAGFRDKLRKKWDKKRDRVKTNADVLKPVATPNAAPVASPISASAALPDPTQAAASATAPVVVPIASSSGISNDVGQKPLEGSTVINDDQSHATQSLWDRAYNVLGKDSPQLVKDYEKLLVQELTASGSVSDNLDSTNRDTLSSGVQSRPDQLDKVIQKGLRRMENQKGKYTIAGHEFVLADQVAQGAKFILWAKDWIGEAVKASPEASIVWSGVCLILPLLTQSETTKTANRDGFAYVTARMRYYVALEPLVQKLGQNVAVSDALIEQVTVAVVDLYQHIIDFQIQSVLRFYQTSLGRYAGDVFGPKDWDKMRQGIKQLEAIVDGNLSQINQFASSQDLESLNKTSKEAYETMSSLLSVSEKQLRVQEEHRDLTQQHIEISREQLEIQRETARQRLSDEQKQCLQLFYLTSDNKETTYEWYKGRVEDRVKGTCKWFLRHNHFRKWLNQNSGPLHVSADPGCGKSVLAKYLIDHVLPLKSATVCYFFFKDQDQNTARQALCALLHQLFCANPTLVKHAMRPYGQLGPRLIDSTAKLWSIFTDAVRDPQAGSVTIVLDALDECRDDEFEDLVKNIQMQFSRDDISQLNHSNFKVLMTSRPYEQIVSGLQCLSKAFPYVRIPGEENSETISREVNRVIRYRVDQLANEERLSEQTKYHLREKLLSIKHRTYLWVYLVFEHLKSGFKKTSKGIEAAIQILPESINQAYERILNRSRDDPMVQKVLSIVLAAERPLTLAEMNVAVNTDDQLQSYEDLDLEEEADFRSRLRSWCGLFISIHQDRIYFLHQTAREFLLLRPAFSPSTAAPLSESRWQNSITLRDAHAVLAGVCVRYLSSFRSIATALPDNDTRLVFLNYSAFNWTVHFREADIADDDAIVRPALEICDSGSNSYAIWSRIYRTPITILIPKPFKELLLASFFGLDSVARQMAENGADVNAKGDVNWTPLRWAVSKGYESMAKILIARGADVNAEDEDGETLLLLAAERRRKAITELLLEHGANTEVTNEIGQTPLLVAAMEGQEAIVRMLLKHGANVHAMDITYQTPFLMAAMNGYEAIVRLILAHGADIDAKDQDGNTPLAWAAGYGRVAVVRLLLESGAEIDAKNNMDQTPLFLAAAMGQLAVVQLLLSKGAVFDEVWLDEIKKSQWTSQEIMEPVIALLESHVLPYQ